MIVVPLAVLNVNSIFPLPSILMPFAIHPNLISSGLMRPITSVLSGEIMAPELITTGKDEPPNEELSSKDNGIPPRRSAVYALGEEISFAGIVVRSHEQFR